MRRMREEPDSHLSSYKISARQAMAVMFPSFLRNKLLLSLTWVMHCHLAESMKVIKIRKQFETELHRQFQRNPSPQSEVQAVENNLYRSSSNIL